MAYVAVMIVLGAAVAVTGAVHVGRKKLENRSTYWILGLGSLALAVTMIGRIDKAESPTMTVLSALAVGLFSASGVLWLRSLRSSDSTRS